MRPYNRAVIELLEMDTGACLRQPSFSVNADVPSRLEIRMTKPQNPPPKPPSKPGPAQPNPLGKPH